LTTSDQQFEIFADIVRRGIPRADLDASVRFVD